MSAPKQVARLGLGTSPRRLQLAFFGLGAFLLLSLAFLSFMVTERLAEARRDREEMVASRVFDEMEREVSAFLETENARPHYLDLENTNPETWVPFVIGYFRSDTLLAAESARVVAAEAATGENRRRVFWALGESRSEWATNIAAPDSWPSLKPDPSPEPPGLGDSSRKEELRSAPTPIREKAPVAPEADGAPSPVQQQRATGSQIIESLNRAPERRKGKASESKKDESTDQFSDYLEAY